jgi:RAT1-interacting protein
VSTLKHTHICIYSCHPLSYIPSLPPQLKSNEDRKLLKFYFQSFLLGVPEILVGFRSTRGILQQTQVFRTLELPRLVRGKPNAWDPNVCLHWGNELLQKVKAWMTDSAPSDVGRILFTPGIGVTFSRLDDAQVLEVVAGEDRVGFLPNWYYHERVNVVPP